MSLRDQLIAKGLVSEKRARQAERELKAERKAQQANRQRKHQAEVEEARQRAEAEERTLQARHADRRVREAAREARERVPRVRQIVRANRLAGRGPVPFAHRVGDTSAIAFMHLPEALVRDLRAGRAAIAACRDEVGAWEHHVVSQKAADKLVEIAPEALLHFVTDREALGDPAEAPLQRTWEPSLRPHRVRDASEARAFLERS